MVTHSFTSKRDARVWGSKTETELMNGTYLKNLKVVVMILQGFS